MSEHHPQPETHKDPHFDEAAANISASLERVMKRYQDFYAGAGELQLAVYKQDQAGIYEPSAYHRLFIKREIDLTDNPATSETTAYHIWLSNDMAGTVSADMELRQSLAGDPVDAQLRQGNIHLIDSALNIFVEAKGL